MTAIFAALRSALLAGAMAALCACGEIPEPPPVAVGTPPQQRCPDCGLRSWRGLYRYLADAAVFTDCSDGSSYPVLLEGDHRALELAYLRDRRKPGELLMVRFKGSLVQRSPDAGAPPRPHLLVQRFEMTLPGHDCDGPRRKPQPASQREHAIAAVLGACGPDCGSRCRT